MKNIIRRDPFYELASLQDRIGNLFGRPFAGFEGFGFEEPLTPAFENGVLKVTLAKREEFKPKQIKIGIGKIEPQPLKTGKEKAA